MSRILVTGGDGFVGRALCPELLKAGHQVRITKRSQKIEARQSNFEIVSVGDIGPETDWTWALENVDAVIHLAGRAHVMRETATDPLAMFRRVNVDGTQRLAESAVHYGVKRLIFISSIKVNGEHTTSAPFKESDQPKPEDAYGQSKWEAEQVLQEISSRTGLETVILRPPLIYGPNVKGNFLTLLNTCNKSLPLPLGAIHNQRSLIFVGNLNNAIIHCLEHEEAAGKTFLVRDDNDISTPDLIRHIATALHVPARLFPAPLKLLKFAGWLVGRKATVTRLTESLTIDDRKIRTLLGWKPPHSMVEGLEQTAAWFKSARFNS